MADLSVALISKRDGPSCAHCSATDGLTIQHRGNRGMGGRKSAERRSNGVILCGAFNVAIEQNADLAHQARIFGWKVSTHDDPARVPYWHSQTGAWWVADDEGERRPATPEEVLAHVERFTPF